MNIGVLTDFEHRDSSVESHKTPQEQILDLNDNSHIKTRVAEAPKILESSL